jgi:type I restriction enzyme M protein
MNQTRFDNKIDEKTAPKDLASIIKSVRDKMRQDKGLNGDIDRIPMITWIMFLKFLDDQENLREAEAQIKGMKFQRTIEPPYRWRDWAAKEDGITGSELLAFVNQDEAIRPDGTRGPGLFAYLRALSGSEGKDRRDVVATVFKGVTNRMINGYLLREVINKINGIQFSSTDEIHTLAYLYESLLKEMRDSAGDAGEFYTPRPVIKFMVQVINPQLGETVLDPAAGTGGFLVESYDYLKMQCNKSEDFETLQKDTLRGFEAKPMPFLLCQMNLLLHGIENPEIDPGNALRFSLRDMGEKDRVDVIMTNPPFGGEEEPGIQGNFPEDKQTAETALLFLQLIMRKIRRPIEGKRGGRCGMVMPNGTLFDTGVGARIKKELLENFNLHTIIRLPKGVFEPYTNIETNLLFFDKDGPTKDIWFYEHPLPPERQKMKNPCYTKSKPLRYEEFKPIMDWLKERVESPHAWKISVEDAAKNSYNLDFKNPNVIEIKEHRNPEEIINSIDEKEERISELLQTLRTQLNKGWQHEQ